MKKKLKAYYQLSDFFSNQSLVMGDIKNVYPQISFNKTSV